MEFSAPGITMESPQKHGNGRHDFSFESPSQSRYLYTNNRASKETSSPSSPSLTGSSTASPDSSLPNSPDKDRNVHVRTNFYKAAGYVPPTETFIPPVSYAQPRQQASTQRASQETSSPWEEDDVPYDQVTNTFSSVTLDTVENIVDNSNSKASAKSTQKNMLYPRPSSPSGSGTNTSIEAPVKLERNTGSRPFDERSHDHNKANSYGEIRNKSSIPIVSEEKVNVASEDDFNRLGFGGGTWDAPLQVFEDDQELLQQQSKYPASVFQALNKRSPQTAKSSSTPAGRRRARRNKFSSVVPSSDDSSIEADQMESLQARAQHAFSLRQHPSAKSTVLAAVSNTSPASTAVDGDQSSKKPMKSAIKSSAPNETTPGKGPTFVSFDDNPDTVHHFISDQVHPTFSDEETVTSQDSETSRSIENQSLQRGMTSLLRDLFYIGETKNYGDDSSSNANDFSVDDSLTADSRQINSKDSSMIQSETTGVSSESQTMTITQTQSATSERSLQSENTTQSSSTLIQNMYVGLQEMSKAFTQESCAPCTDMKEDFARNVEYKMPVATENILDSASAEEPVFQPLPDTDTDGIVEENEEDNGKMGSLPFTRSMESSAVSEVENSLETDPRLSELAFHTAKTVHKLHGLTLDDKDIDAEIITQLEFKVVRIGLPLGLLFHQNGGGCWIAKIFPGGNATKTSCGDDVKVGDQLAAVDGRSAIKMTVDDICSLIATAENMQSIELTLLRYVGPLRNESTDSCKSTGDSNGRETRLSVSQDKNYTNKSKGSFLKRMGTMKRKGQNKFRLFGGKKKVVY